MQTIKILRSHKQRMNQINQMDENNVPAMLISYNYMDCEGDLGYDLEKEAE